MIHVNIIASGTVYQKAAALAAATFAVRAGDGAQVTALIPEGEPIHRQLERLSRPFGFEIERFPHARSRATQATARLKCDAFAWRTPRLNKDEIVLFADADTCCLKAVRLSASAKKSLRSGDVGLVADVKDRHSEGEAGPWRLEPDERAVYVNSGVIFSTKRSADFFAAVQDLSKEPRFFGAPFQDQAVINYAFGKYFRESLLLMERKFNTIFSINGDTVIAHLAGGAGLLGIQRRRARHECMCLKVLGEDPIRWRLRGF